ncbi:hypothetical protein EOM09_08580 [bacterium]|nr:hypothetical protein [bacterium]
MKNYVKIFEEDNVTLIKKTRTNVSITFVLLLGVFPLLCAFFGHNILPEIILYDNSIWFSYFFVWCICFFIGMIFTYTIERQIKRPLKILAQLFARNVVVIDLINILRTNFDFEISNDFIQNSAHGYEYSLSGEDWLDSCSFKSHYRIYFREVVFTVNNLKYKLTKTIYQNNKPFRFYFDIGYPDGRIERDVEYEF